MNKILLSFISITFFIMYPSDVKAQQWAIGTNGLNWLTTSPNIEIEYSFHKRMSTVISGSYNPFTFKNNRKIKHLIFQGEYRYWLSESFKGHYLGLQIGGGSFNFNKLPFGVLKDYRYEGDIWGGGVTYGFQWIVSNRVNIGTSFAMGYAHLNYNKFYCPTCGEKIEHYKSDYFGPTKIGISIIYLLK